MVKLSAKPISKARINNRTACFAIVYSEINKNTEAWLKIGRATLGNRPSLHFRGLIHACSMWYRYRYQQDKRTTYHLSQYSPTVPPRLAIQFLDRYSLALETSHLGPLRSRDTSSESALLSPTRTKLGVLFSFWWHLWKECNRHIFMAKSAQSLSS